MRVVLLTRQVFLWEVGGASRRGRGAVVGGGCRGRVIVGGANLLVLRRVLRSRCRIYGAEAFRTGMFDDQGFWSVDECGKPGCEY